MPSADPIILVDSSSGQTLELALDGSPLTARARLNGENDRGLLERVAEHGAGTVVVVLQGVLRPPATAGGPFVLEGDGFQVNIKAPRPSEPAGEPPQGRVGPGRESARP